MGRKLIEYYPPVLQEFSELQAIAGAEQAEIERLWENQYAALDNQFVATAEESGIRRWEKILGIVPKATTGIQERRFLILTRLAEELPYTMCMLRQQLDALCGVGNYSIQLDAGTYTLIVRVALTARSNYDDTENLLERVAPANLILDLSLLYNQHSMVKKYTHKQLQKISHYNIRNEVM